MTLEEFESTLDEHGADLTLWPVSLRPEAHLLLDVSHEAKDILAFAKLSEKAIEQHLSAPIKAPSHLTDRILAQAFTPELTSAQTVVADVPVWWQSLRDSLFGPWSVGVAALSICFFSGIMVSQMQFSEDADVTSRYVAHLYADLAW